MTRRAERVFKTVGWGAGIYLGLCIALYLFQERLIFSPSRLDRAYRFSFDGEFKELYIPTSDGDTLHGLHFKAIDPKGLVFFLHGNAGAMDTWGQTARSYTDRGWDIMMIDYRGFGKSTGSISNQAQFLEDIQTAYDTLRHHYGDTRIVIVGYSIGSGPAAWLASQNHPKALILQAPYYSLRDMMRHRYPGVPTFLLKYQFDTYRYMEACRCPVSIVHGTDDPVIYFGSSEKLQQHFKDGDTMLALNGWGHGNITRNRSYQELLDRVIGRKVAG